jgi:tetratricopeptide (TPR) repeat protein
MLALELLIEQFGDILPAPGVPGRPVNERTLYDIEAEGSPSTSAAAYFIAARYADQHSEGEAARKYMKRCIEFGPEQAGLLEWYSVLLLDGGQYQEAVTQAEHAAKRARNPPKLCRYLGWPITIRGGLPRPSRTGSGLRNCIPAEP